MPEYVGICVLYREMLQFNRASERRKAIRTFALIATQLLTISTLLDRKRDKRDKTACSHPNLRRKKHDRDYLGTPLRRC